MCQIDNLYQFAVPFFNIVVYKGFAVEAQQIRREPQPDIRTMTDSQDPIHGKRDPTVRERLLSSALLGILALVAVGMLWSQSRFDAGAWRERAQPVDAGGEIRRPGPSAPRLPAATDAAAGLEPLAPAERYGPDTLSDKIDGKAELYLNAGFIGLESRRFALSGDKRRWMERYVYDMGGFPGAFAVFSSQRRPQAQPLAWAVHGYLAGNALFFVQGPFYVEIVGTEASQEVQKGLEALAMAFSAAHAAQSPDPVELQLLPRDQRIAHSEKLTARAAFGIQGLDWIFTAVYSSSPGQAEALAFVSRRDSPAEAAAMAEKFHAFWIEFGGSEIPSQDGSQGVRSVSILDNYEICMARGRYLIGVHEATNLDFGLHLMEQLQRNLAGAES
jgi:hypothetical protein